MEPVRRYRLIGGMAGWRLPLLALLLLLCAAGLREWALGAAVALIGATAAALERARVIEVSPGGLSRGLELGGRLLAVRVVLGWESVTDIESDWRRPGDQTEIETAVADRTGAWIRFGTRMGLPAYRALLADVTRLAPRARRTGLTDRLLEEESPAPGLGQGGVDVGLLLAATLIVVWAVALPFIFARY
jgi:hypothetical protein